MNTTYIPDLTKAFFGDSDANTEKNRNPQKFEKSFYDPHNYLYELLDEYKFVVSGRKGDGKSAYSAKICLMSEQSSSQVKAVSRSLSNFNNVTFSKLKTYKNLGGNPYISLWKCILMIETVNMIESFQSNIQANSYCSILSALDDAGLLENDNVSNTIDTLVETNTSLNIKDLISHGKRKQTASVLSGAEQIYSSIYKAIKTVYMGDIHYYLIIDGLDDILINSDRIFQSTVLTGLLRAADEINTKFIHETLHLKILIMMRSDILNLCVDSNIQKIKDDSCINLSWKIDDNLYESDLVKLVEKRLNITNDREIDFEEYWNSIFPQLVGTKPSFEYMLENIIYRPRDILRFFKESQMKFKNRRYTIDEFEMLLTDYSENYFLDAMKNELAGFFPDEIVNKLPEIISKLGSQYFYMHDVEKIINADSSLASINVYNLLDKLFNAGYIGQHRPRDIQNYTVFKYRNPHETFHENDECIIHRGLQRALSLL